MPHSNPTMNRTTWEVGQRVARRNGGELGTVTEHDGQIKVIWDGGRTSYFRHGQAANVQLEEVDE